MATALLNRPRSANLSNNNYAFNNLQWCWVSVDKYGQDTVSLPPLENTWVHLLSSEQDVLLLCSLSDSEWVVWNPDCGEQILRVEQFCVIPSR
jgi:hypothetical protein